MVHPEIRGSGRMDHLQSRSFCLIAIIFGIGVGTYNTNYLSHTPDRKPVTISHRGVNGNNGVQKHLGLFNRDQ